MGEGILGGLVDYQQLQSAYDFSGRTVVVTGGAGVLGGEMACAVAACGGNVIILDRNADLADQVGRRIAQLTERCSGCGRAVYGDVLDKESLFRAEERIVMEFGKIDALINCAGGNRPAATASPGQPFFDLPEEALRSVLDLNLLGTILPCQVFGRVMAKQGEGVILNVSSMNASRPLTRVVAYSAGKAGISNFTQWLAVHMAQNYSPRIRVNAIAPGFFLTEQNRFLLTDRETGALTQRGETILQHTPMARFGAPEDLLGAVLWLLSPLSSFVTGVVIPIDGGFSAFSGV